VLVQLADRLDEADRAVESRLVEQVRGARGCPGRVVLVVAERLGVELAVPREYGWYHGCDVLTP
jgi:hypothetical protein